MLQSKGNIFTIMIQSNIKYHDIFTQNIEKQKAVMLNMYLRYQRRMEILSSQYQEDSQYDPE